MPSERNLRVAVIGWEVERQSQEANLDKAEGYIREACERGADAIGFVEYFSLLGTSIPHRDAAEVPGDGPVTRWAVDMSSRYGIEIWCPFIELDGEGSKYNSVAFVDPGDGVVGTSGEFHFFALERQGLNVARDIPVFQRPWGTLGCFICFDIHFPEIARVLSLKGAEAVFWPTLTRGPWSIESVRQKAAVRCMDNGFWLIESNVASGPPYAPYKGRAAPGSSVFDPEGVMVANTGRRPGMCIVDIDLNRGSYAHEETGLNVKSKNVPEVFKSCLRADYYSKASCNGASRNVCHPVNRPVRREQVVQQVPVLP